MLTQEMKKQYDEYLTQHISNVELGFNWLYANIPEIFEGYDAEYLGDLISNHDASKYTAVEYDAYGEYFYGKEKSKEVKEAFDLAWLNHQHQNPHHWQHWLLREDDGDLKPLPMPYEYIIEMVCDHWAFSWAKNDLYEIFDWYKENKSKMLLHRDTQQAYEDILDLLKAKLDELHN